MPRKSKKQAALFNEADQEKNCIQFLKERGYAVFKAGSVSSAEEEEAVKKLRAVGYKVEHIKDALVKLDPTKLRTVDDVAVYFHGMMKRHNPKRHNERRLKDRKLRLVDHSVINSFISWRMDEGASLADSIEDMILLIDVLFEKSEPWNIDVRGMGILSVNNNKPFVLSLMNEVRLKKDARLSFQVNDLLGREEAHNYVNVLMYARKRMDEVKPPTVTKKRKTIDME